jgi:hypothetical protein
VTFSKYRCLSIVNVKVGAIVPAVVNMRACTAHPLAFEWTGAFRYVREHVRATRIDVEFIAAPDNYCFDKYEVRVFCICPSGNTCTFRCVYARQRPCKRPLLSKRRRCVRSSTATQRCASADGRLQMFPLENITSRYALHTHTHTHSFTRSMLRMNVPALTRTACVRD